MKRLVWVLGLFALVPYGAFGQATESATGRVIGEVTTIEASAKQLTVKTDTGNLVSVLLNESTSYLRVPPGEKDLKKATKIALSDIGVGDRVYARGQLSED